MQLNKKIGLAVAGLLLGPTAQAEDWEVDAALLSYSETDSQGQDRVSILEPVLFLTTTYGQDDFASYRFVYDTLTGATPNGAHASSVVQEFPGYTVEPGLTPLDHNFEDQRFAMDYIRGKPLTATSRYTWGASFSVEQDYASAGANFSFMHDLNEKQTTLTLSAAFSYDLVDPVGGMPDPLTPITLTRTSGGKSDDDDEYEDDDDYDDDDEGFFGEGDDKINLDFLVGVTHILNPLTYITASYSLRTSKGYLTDPYKMIPVVNLSGVPVEYLWESRPDSRTRHTLMTEFVTAFGDDSLRMSYRYFWDDWGITTHTVDARYHLDLGKLYLSPHLRFSRQGRADFYRVSLYQGQVMPAHASSDYRLGDMDSTTAGVLLGFRLSPVAEIYLNLERMRQSGDSDPPEAIGDQHNHDLFPDVDMTMITAGMKFKW